MILKIKAFINNESGATAIEYALIATLISTAIISGATGLWKYVEQYYVSVSSNF